MYYSSMLFTRISIFAKALVTSSTTLLQFLSYPRLVAIAMGRGNLAERFWWLSVEGGSTLHGGDEIHR